LVVCDHDFNSPRRFEVVLRPAGLSFDHRLEGLDRECVPSAVWRDRYPSAIRVAIALMRSPLADKTEALTHAGDDDFSGSQRMEATVVDSHGLDSNRNVRPILGDLFNLDGIPRAFR